MKRSVARFLFTAVAVLFSSTLAPLAKAERVTLKVMVDGAERTALIDPGKEATTTPSPVLLLFHGQAQRQTAVDQYRLTETWPEATIVYPQGLRQPDGLTGWQLLPGDQDDRDVRFTDVLLKELATRYKVDEQRVYVAGISMGGVFTYVLLTLRPDRFAAFALVAAAPWTPTSLKWAAVPRPVLIVHGKKDAAGPPAMAEWARNQLQRLNNCGPAATEWKRGAVRYEPCTSGQPVIYAIHQGGHGWPAETSENVVQFFREHALAAPPPAAGFSTEPDTSGTVAGSGKSGLAGDRNPATTARLRFPEGVAVNSDGTLSICDTGNLRIRKVSPDGIIRSVPEGLFWFPQSIVLDREGNLFTADTHLGLVFKLRAKGGIPILVAGLRPGGGGAWLHYQRIGFSGDNGPATKAELSFVGGLAIDGEGNLFIADTENHRVRKVTPDGTITTIVGTGTAGFSGDNGKANGASLNAPMGLALDSKGNLYIADAGNHRVRKLAKDGTITTVAGVGTAGFSGDAGPAPAAQLNQPSGLAVDSEGYLFIVDRLNHRIRKVALDETITTVFGGGPGNTGTAPQYYPASVAIDRQGNLLIADPFNHRVWKVAGLAAPGLLAGQPFPEAGP